jgi:hypothetical protein
VGWPRVVLLRGEVIVADGKFIGKAGQGVFVRSGLSSALS